jgi:hypothetical protein
MDLYYLHRVDPHVAVNETVPRPSAKARRPTHVALR